MVARLAQAPATIGELAGAVRDVACRRSRSTCACLNGLSLVRRTIDGRIHRCTLERKRLKDANAWIERYTTFWGDTLGALAAFVEDK